MKVLLLHLKKAFILLLFASFSFSFSSCNMSVIEPSGHMVEKTYAFDGITDWHISSYYSVEFVKSDVDSLVLEVDENLLPCISIQKEGEELSIGVRKGGFVGSRFMTPVVNAKVYYTNIKKLYVGGASHCKWGDTLIVDDLEIKISGASSVKGIILAKGELDIHLRGASLFEGQCFSDRKAEISTRGVSDIKLGGLLQEAEMKLSGASSIVSFDLTVQNLEISLSGASGARVNVSKTLEAKTSGASSLVYMGAPEIVSQKRSGASEISRKGSES